MKIILVFALLSLIAVSETRRRRNLDNNIDYTSGRPVKVMDVPTVGDFLSSNQKLVAIHFKDEDCKDYVVSTTIIPKPKIAYKNPDFVTLKFSGPSETRRGKSVIVLCKNGAEIASIKKTFN